MTRYFTDKLAKYIVFISGFTAVVILLLIALFILRKDYLLFGNRRFRFYIRQCMATGYRPVRDSFYDSRLDCGYRRFDDNAVPLGIACAILLAEVAPSRYVVFCDRR